MATTLEHGNADDQIMDTILEFGLGINFIPQEMELSKLTKLYFTSSEIFYTSKCCYTGHESHNVFPIKG